MTDTVCWQSKLADQTWGDTVWWSFFKTLSQLRSLSPYRIFQWCTPYPSPPAPPSDAGTHGHQRHCGQHNAHSPQQWTDVWVASTQRTGRWVTWFLTQDWVGWWKWRTVRKWLGLEDGIWDTTVPCAPRKKLREKVSICSLRMLIHRAI